MSKDNMEYRDTMVLGSGHSILVSHVPPSKPVNEVVDKFYEASKTSKQSIDNFGLFGSDIDYNTYYPDVNPEEFNPQDSEFIEPVFRLLSACIVSKNYAPTEFPEEVLKSSMNLLVGQTVNCDHETNIGNAIGTVKSVAWQDSYTVDGVVIPGGINGVLKIDGKANPRIARGIMMNPPSIHSNSVTVQFAWEPSHNFENMEDFFYKLGTYDENGEMIRRVATKIISFKETSLVSHGADPFAQLIVDNKILNPTYAGAVYYSFSEAPIPKDHVQSKYGYWDFKGNQEIDLMYNTTNSYYINNKQIKANMDEKTKQQNPAESLFGEGLLTLKEGENPSVELALSQVKNILSENAQLREQASQYTTEINSLKEKVASLENAAKVNEGMVALGAEYLKNTREDALASYKKLMGDKVDENIISLLEATTTSLQTLQSLNKMYVQQLDEKFPLHCSDCGSHNVSRSSSVVKTEEEDNLEEKPNNDGIVDVLGDIAKNKLK